jgi:Putative zinc-finger
MSRPRDPSPDPSGTGHPDELLAAYTDGSASASEVAAADAHLAGCERCRAEVQVARRALLALRGLPELVTPWAGTGTIGGSIGKSIAGVGTPPPQEAPSPSPSPVRSLADRRARSRSKVAALVGLAAAASVAAVVVFALHPGGSGSSANAPEHLAETGGPPAITQAQLAALTAELSRDARNLDAHPSFAAGSAAPVRKASVGLPLPAQPTIAPDAAIGVPCARRVSGQSISAVAVYAQDAVFDDERVWVVAFITTPSNGGPTRIEVVAATTSDCTLVYAARQTLS